MNREDLVKLVKEFNCRSEFKIECIYEDLAYPGDQTFKYILTQVVKPRPYTKHK